MKTYIIDNNLTATFDAEPTSAAIEQVKAAAQYFKDRQPARWAIGIDPGEKTGIAIWNLEAMAWETITTTTAIEAEEIVKLYHGNGGCMVICEDARQRKWFGNTDSERLQGAGYAKQASKHWEQWLRHHRIPFRMQKPGSTWKGAAAAKTWANLTGWKGKTSDHARDAAWMVFQVSRTKMEVLCGVG